MAEINSLIHWLLYALPLAVSARIIYCLIALTLDAERAPELKRRIRNAACFLVGAETIVGLLAVVSSYYVP